MDALVATLAEVATESTFGNKGTVMLLCTVDFDGGDYATGGVAVDFSGYITTIYFVAMEPTDGYVYIYDSVNSKMKVYFADYNAVADGALIEFTNATAFDHGPVKCLVIGRT